jgi:hypothetical protein
MGTTLVDLTLILKQAENSVGAVKSKANLIETASKGLDSIKPFQMTAEAIKNLQDQVNSLLQLVEAFAKVLALIPGPQITTQVVTLVTATTKNIVPASTAPANGDMLFIKTVQDGTGLGLITWDASFRGVSVNMNDPHTVNSACFFLFVGSGGYWCLSGLPLIGVPAP